MLTRPDSSPPLSHLPLLGYTWTHVLRINSVMRRCLPPLHTDWASLQKSFPLANTVCARHAPLNALHFHSCPRNKRKGVLRRHDKVKQALAHIARCAGCTVYVEPSIWVADANGPDQGAHGGHYLDRKVPDLRIEGIGRPVLVDVSIICASADSHFGSVAASKSCRSVFEYRETRKTTFYKAATEQDGGEFFAFVLNSVGGFGQPAKSLLKKIASHAARSNYAFQDYTSFYLWSVSQISCALQEGNLAVETQGIAIQSQREQ
jgi:hypothetical protein